MSPLLLAAKRREVHIAKRLVKKSLCPVFVIDNVSSMTCQLDPIIIIIIKICTISPSRREEHLSTMPVSGAATNWLSFS